MKKRGQATVFIIFAIIIVLAIGIAYFINKNSNQNIFTSADDKAKLNSILGSIETCRDLSADNSVIRIGIQGGYNKPPETYLDYGWMFIPYYFIEGKTYLPDKNKVEQELADIFNQNFQRCLEIIDTKGFVLKTTPSKTSVQIADKTIRFDIGMKLTIGNGLRTGSYDLKKEPLIRNYKLYEMYEVAKYITDSHNKNPPMLCMDCLLKIADDRGLFVDFKNLEKTTKLVIISEALNSTSDNSNYVFQFIEKYKGEEKTSAPKLPQNA